MSYEFDLAIIGSGSAAFAAAIHARGKGKSVVMIERSEIGGACVNVGCIPSKALLAAAEARHIASDQRFPGVHTNATDLDLNALIGGKDEIVADLQQAKYRDLIDEYGWTLLAGTARFEAGPVLQIDGQRIEAAHYLIATGAAPRAPPVDGLAGLDYLTSTSAMELKELPRSMIVMGGNYVGLEMGQLFARLGVKARSLRP